MRDLRVHFPTPCPENWDMMTPAGRHRACAKCDRVIHDLSQYDADGVEALLRDQPESCVRASVNALGVVATAPARDGRIRRIIATVGASTGLLISAPVLAGDRHVDGAITGTVRTLALKVRVTAKDQNGNLFRARARESGKYTIKNVPAGTYTVEFNPDCGESWTIENVVVGQGETDLADTANEGGCIVVGMLRIDDGKG